MPALLPLAYFSLTALVAYLWSLTSLTAYTPQLLALVAIIFVVFKNHKSSVVYLLSFISCLLVFITGGLNSPVFFLIYFLLLVIAFNHPPTLTLAFSLVLILLLSQSLNSLNSILPLFSLLLITPLAWFIGRQYLAKKMLTQTLAVEETDFLFWLSLKFKTGITVIIDTASQLLSSPGLSHTQKEQLKYLKDSAKSLLNSANKLTHEDH